MLLQHLAIHSPYAATVRNLQPILVALALALFACVPIREAEAGLETTVVE